MNRQPRQFLTTLVLMAMSMGGCTHQPAATQDREAKSAIGQQPMTAPDATKLATTLPLAAVWRDSVGLAGGSPSLRIVIWDDGSVLFAQDPAKWDQQLRLGHISQDMVSQVKRQIVDTGVFQLAGNCYLVPDAPVLCLLANVNERRQLLFWDEVETPGYGINIAPKPHHLAFKKAWQSLNRLLVASIPTESTPVSKGFIPPGSWYVKKAIQSE